MQRLTLCGVSAHHQNGIVERAIKSLTLITRTILLHAQRHWPEYITTMLWPLALRAAQDRMNQRQSVWTGKHMTCISPTLLPQLSASGTATHGDAHVIYLTAAFKQIRKGYQNGNHERVLGYTLGGLPTMLVMLH
ncbi:hypothetical protein ACHAXS_004483 [Conticribra weissflogii]